MDDIKCLYLRHKMFKARNNMNFNINNNEDEIRYYNANTYDVFDKKDIININLLNSNIKALDVIIYLIAGIKKLNNTETIILKHIYEESIKSEKNTIKVKELISKYSNIDFITNITYNRNINNLIKKGIICVIKENIYINKEYYTKDIDKCFVGITIK